LARNPRDQGDGEGAIACAEQLPGIGLLLDLERILRAAGLSEDDDRRREIRGLWATSDERRRNGTLSKMRTG